MLWKSSQGSKIESAEAKGQVDDVESFEKEFGSIPETVRNLKSASRLEIFMSDVRLFDAFEVNYRKEISRFGEKPRVAVLSEDRHVEVQFALQNSEVTAYVPTQREADKLESLGIPAQKFNPESQLAEHPVDMMFVLRDDVDSSWKFIRNIEQGGLLLCPGKMAQKLLEESGHFHMKGTLNKERGPGYINKSKREDYWKLGVKTDAKFRTASEKLKPGSEFVSYGEAKQALKDAGKGEPSNVLEEYLAFITKVLEDPSANVNEEAGTVTYTDSETKKSVTLKIHPPFDVVDDDLIFVLKKREFGRAS